jgi:hypothetical protein
MNGPREGVQRFLPKIFGGLPRIDLLGGNNRNAPDSGGG